MYFYFFITQIHKKHSPLKQKNNLKMIVDSLHNAAKYYSLHPAFEKAFQFLKENDLANLADGVTQYTDDLKIIVNSGNGNSKEQSLAFFECHEKNIDIQVCVAGPETYAWKPLEKCENPNGAYSDEKDVRFFFDQPDMFFELQPGQFTILFPTDVHAAMISNGKIKKIVIKVKI